ncbi:MAG TPA: A/G-specific adenine glycosylase [Mycobacteriales bacterium]|jgi:A/G-specific adenine glycosylase|nr:A/G-specific adenine glycosylase [Mycobacteriales bacterium]
MVDACFAALPEWYDANARDLPWRSSGVTPWGVLVSEVMLQQTPAARVAPVWQQWIDRWPAPVALAAEPPGEAVRAWGRLGYPRRALRLRESAVAMVERHDGEVPSSYDDLLALPGIGGYTAAAVATFGFGQRHAVLDTNVRRVLARVIRGEAGARSSAPTVAERAEALALVPDAAPGRHSIAVMELGAVICTATAPRCSACPLEVSCAWHRLGRPDGPPARRPQRYAGTDRQVRGRLLAVLRDATGTVDQRSLDEVWDDVAQRERALAGLIADGLVEPAGTDHYRLPT